MDRARLPQTERPDLGIEAFAVLDGHLIAATHLAKRRRKWTTRGVFKGFARIEVGLLAHHTGTAHFVHLTGPVGDQPASADQLHRHRTFVGDPDRVEEEPELITGI